MKFKSVSWLSLVSGTYHVPFALHNHDQRKGVEQDCNHLAYVQNQYPVTVASEEACNASNKTDSSKDDP